MTEHTYKDGQTDGQETHTDDRETDAQTDNGVPWVFTPSQPLQLYQGDTEGQTDKCAHR